MEEIQVEEQKPEQYATEIDFEQCDAVETTEDSSRQLIESKIESKSKIENRIEPRSNRNRNRSIAGELFRCAASVYDTTNSSLPH